MFTCQELIEQFPHTFSGNLSLIRTTLVRVKVVIHSSLIDHCSMFHTFWLYDLPCLGQSSSLLMKASCWKLKLVESDQKVESATVFNRRPIRQTVADLSCLSLTGVKDIIWLIKSVKVNCCLATHGLIWPTSKPLCPNVWLVSKFITNVVGSSPRSTSGSTY